MIKRTTMLERAESPRLTAPRPPSPPRFFEAGRFNTEAHRFMHDLFQRYGDVLVWRGFYDVYLVNHPESVRPILSQSYEHYSKKTIDYRVLKQIMGNGLVSNDGPDWVKQRKIMQPLFSNRNVNSFDTAINALTAAHLDQWRRQPAGEAIWVDREMRHLTFNIVGATLFGSDIDRHADEVAEILDVVNLRPQDLRALLTLISWLPVRSNRRWRKAKKRLDKIVYGLIDQRRRQGIGDADMLDRLLSARDETGSAAMDEKQLRDEVVTLMLAGHETSANALGWTLYLLSEHPDIEAQLFEHLDAVLGGRPAEASDLNQLPYLKQVVQESMRLFPPVWAIARRSEHDAIYHGFAIPAKSYIGVVPYALHRHPDYWSEPTRFDPDRFAPENTKGRHSYCYLPFAAGPRACIGASMAMLEIQLVLAQLVQRYRLTMVPDHPVDTVAKVTLNPRHGLPMTITPR